MESVTPPARARFWPSILVGVASAVVMLFPSWVGGGILPLQNLWHEQTMPDDMPFSLLPISQYYAISIFVMLLLGGVVAGLVVRFAGRRWMLRPGPAALGVLLVHLIVTIQAFAVLGTGLGLWDGTAGGRELLYVGGMLGGVVAGILLAQLGLWLTSRQAVGPAALGIVLAAVPFANWIGTAITAFTTYMGYPQFRRGRAALAPRGHRRRDAGVVRSATARTAGRVGRRSAVGLDRAGIVHGEHVRARLAGVRRRPRDDGRGRHAGVPAGRRRAVA
jgi:hypothetical protein